MATRTGRSVREVWNQSYALTLWIDWHLNQQDRITEFRAQCAQHDMATLTAFAVCEPDSLPKLRDHFIAMNRLPRHLSRRAREEAERRVQKMLTDHAHMIRIPGPMDEGIS